MNKLSKSEFVLSIDFSSGHITSFCYGLHELLNLKVQLPLFTLCLRKKDGKAEVISAYSFRECKVTSDNAEGYSALYSGFDCMDLFVVAKVELTDKYLFKWSIDVLNHSDSVVEWVDYPLMAFKQKRTDDKNARILFPYNEGVLIDDIHLRDTTFIPYREPGYPGCSIDAIFPGMVESQFIAYMGDIGIYLGAHDSTRCVKNIDFVPFEDAVRLKMRIYTGCGFGESYTMGFDIVHAGFVGDWHDAAEIYRNWFENNNEGFVPIEKDDSLPSWYNNSPVILIYPVRGLFDTDEMSPNRMFPYTNALPIIEEFAEKLESQVMALLMHWEGTAPWAPPFVWPPYGGEEALKDFINELHDRGHLLGLYLSGLGWTQQSNLTEYNMEEFFEDKGIREIVSLSPEQELLPSLICTAQRSGYDMCPACEKTQEIVLTEVRHMSAAGVDYAQVLDQNHGGHPYVCYARNHGHPPTPGLWSVNTMRKLIQRMQETASGMIFGCESAASEPYITGLRFSDNRFNLGFLYGQPVPLYAYVYHRYVSNFMGNQVCADFAFDSPDDLLYRIAYSFVAGDMLSLVLTDNGQIMRNWCSCEFNKLPDRALVLELVKNLNNLRRGVAKEYLHTGSMIKPLELFSVDMVNLPVTEGKALSVPQVLTSRWRTENGNEAQVLVNFGCCASSCEMELPSGKRLINLAPLSALLITE